MKKGHFVENGSLENVGDYSILFQWDHLTWDFELEDKKKAFYDQ